MDTQTTETFKEQDFKYLIGSNIDIDVGTVAILKANSAFKRWISVFDRCDVDGPPKKTLSDQSGPRYHRY